MIVCAISCEEVWLQKMFDEPFDGVLDSTVIPCNKLYED